MSAGDELAAAIAAAARARRRPQMATVVTSSPLRVRPDGSATTVGPIPFVRRRPSIGAQVPLVWLPRSRTYVAIGAVGPPPPGIMVRIRTGPDTWSASGFPNTLVALWNQNLSPTTDAYARVANGVWGGESVIPGQPTYDPLTLPVYNGQRHFNVRTLASGYVGHHGAIVAPLAGESPSTGIEFVHPMSDGGVSVLLELVTPPGSADNVHGRALWVYFRRGADSTWQRAIVFEPGATFVSRGRAFGTVSEQVGDVIWVSFVADSLPSPGVAGTRLARVSYNGTTWNVDALVMVTAGATGGSFLAYDASNNILHALEFNGTASVTLRAFDAGSLALLYSTPLSWNAALGEQSVGIAWRGGTLYAIGNRCRFYTIVPGPSSYGPPHQEADVPLGGLIAGQQRVLFVAEDGQLVFSTGILFNLPDLQVQPSFPESEGNWWIVDSDSRVAGVYYFQDSFSFPFVTFYEGAYTIA